MLLAPIVDEANEQHEIYKELQQKDAELSKEMLDIKEELQSCSHCELELTSMHAKLIDFVEENTNCVEPNPEAVRDQMCQASQEVLDLLAEELAIEEYLLALDELLADHKLTGDDFIHEVRNVTRRQYLCRVELQKATQEAFAAVGLPVPVSDKPGTERLGVERPVAVIAQASAAAAHSGAHAVPVPNWRTGVMIAS